MTFYAEMADVATELLTEFGQTVTITRTTGGSIDPVTGVETPGTTAVYSPVGVLKPYPNRLIDGTRIKAGDRELIVDDTVEPLLTDAITVNGEALVAQEIEVVSPAGTPIVYKIRVRR